jgi:hypothetical protein
MRVCPVCRADLDDLGKRRDAVYCSGACRAEASARRRGTSTRRTEAHRKRTRRQGERKQRRSRTPDLRISYRKATAELADWLDFLRSEYHLPLGEPIDIAEAVLGRLLTERQRAAAEGRAAK